MKKIHSILGFAILITFLITGQYMHHKFAHLSDMEKMQRALFRAGHLYILLFGLINIALGAYYKVGMSFAKQFMQVTGSIVVIIASGICIYSFFVELPPTSIERPLSRLSLYLILAGVLFHVWPDKKVVE